MVSIVIMAGGKGERFWPRSRQSLPKQLISLTNDGKTMIQLTYERVKKITDKENVFIVTNENYSNIIRKQLFEIPFQNILIEPLGKNTAPCIGLSAVYIAKKDPEAVMIILPSDHLIKNNDIFINTLEAAAKMAQEGDNLITIGIIPSYPETGYGYINYSNKVCDIDGNSIYKVKRFVEKPDIDKAKQYLKEGTYLWNSGMFVWKASTILKNIQRYMPNLYEGLMKISDAIGTDNEIKVLREEFNKFESISIDYGIMEHAENIYTIPGNFGWDDVGSWTALERIQNTDEDGNVKSGNVISIDTKKCIIQGNDKLIAAVGIEDIILVDTDDATLICSKDKCQDIKKLLNKIKAMNKENYL
ncbi:mannose-1-phosphate guanylyltransferase [Caloramator quimbayensis]|uniref:mannose-1-phosphate guanylyltransferase n=1 Tax=Caloramator quimbayensis TaxID=1147123 RepID=A0A1T4WHH3_9CLOT|nr:mannose-1-phosphate guanylyltransferase [Caloramator quimbayensis]SKA76657.1 mannose-1-phosphate guanylyltransferase [Caloramator quimbayensis]